MKGCLKVYFLVFNQLNQLIEACDCYSIIGRDSSIKKNALFRYRAILWSNTFK